MLGRVVAVACALVLAVHLWLVRWTVDDAYIAYRYAENLARGWGPVYNPGEWVEGYTSVAWVVALAGLHAIGLPTEWVGKGLGELCAIAIPLTLLGAPRWAPIGPRGAAAAALMAGTSGVIVGWAAGGLEVTAGALVTLVAWWGHLAGKRWAPIVAALCPLVRPELLLVPLVMLADHVVARGVREAGALALALAVLVGGSEAFRLWAYGWPLPNTFYAKVGATGEQVRRGLEYLAGWLATGGALVLVALAGVRGLPRAWWPVVGWGILHVGFVVAVGGDALPAWRFFAPIVPVAALLGGRALERVHPRGEWLAVAVAAVHLAGIALDPQQAPKMGRDAISANGREAGLWLAANFPPDTVIATNTAGSVPYFSGFVSIDMLGLCDAHIAHTTPPDMGARMAGHEKGDGAYVLSREPDLVLFGAALGRKDPVFRSDRELDASPEFHRLYALEEHRLPSGKKLVLWRRQGPSGSGTR
jgi:hypothetical protein